MHSTELGKYSFDKSAAMVRARRRTRQQRSAAGRRRHPQRWVGITAGVVLIAGGGYLVGHGEQNPSTATVSAASPPTEVSRTSIATASRSPSLPTSTGRPTTALALKTTAPHLASTTAAVPSVARASIDARSATAALAVLATVTVSSDRAAGYQRSAFGSAWTDDVTVPGGHNGCDTRNDILRRDLNALVIKPGSHGCSVLSGTLADPYTGRTVGYLKSGPASIDIDHVVALGDAWRSGAAGWAPVHRRDFANDPANLTAVGASANESKGDSSAASWLPPNKNDRCAYVSQQTRVKKRYLLTVTPAERDAIARVLVGCGGVAPAATTTPAPAATTVRITAPPPPTSIRPLVRVPTSSEAPSDVYYKNCKAAREAGAAPLLRGEPGYRAGLDGDDDGVACEN